MATASENHPLVVSRVVGDVVDAFTTTTELRVVCNGGKHVFNGCTLRPSHVAKQPTVEIGGDDFRISHTLILVDADAPSPSNPYLKEYLHWMVTDIPASTGTNFGQEVVKYESPQPSIGIHRLVFLLFQQQGRQTVSAPDQRCHFNTRQFSQLYNLGSPVAALYFNCHRENGTGGRRFH